MYLLTITLKSIHHHFYCHHYSANYYPLSLYYSHRFTRLPVFITIHLQPTFHSSANLILLRQKSVNATPLSPEGSGHRVLTQYSFHIQHDPIVMNYLPTHVTVSLYLCSCSSLCLECLSTVIGICVWLPRAVLKDSTLSNSSFRKASLTSAPQRPY